MDLPPMSPVATLSATSVFEGLDEPVSIFTLDGTYVYINAEGEQLLARSRADLLGRTYLDVFPDLAAHPYHAAFQRVASRQSALERLEFYYPPLDRWSRQRIRCVEDHVIVIWQDITAQKQAEHEQRRVLEQITETLESMGDGFFHLDPQWRMTRVNRVQERLSRIPRAESLGRSFWDVFPDAKHLKFSSEYRRVMEHRVEAHFEEHYPLLDVWTEVDAFPTRDGGIAVFFRDISDRRRHQRQAEQLLASEQRARTVAEAASRAKDEFLAMLGHELRNPLAPIMAALELVRLRGPMDTAREVAVIDRQLQHLVRLVDDLLDVSRITRGHVELSRGHLELAEVAATAIEMASPLLQQRRHLFDATVAQGLTVDGDASRLAQVISNLIVNAAKYTPEGGRITLSAQRDGSDVVLRVADTGVGIPAELLPHIFDMFVQGRQGIDRAEGGLGLGLAIVRRLVELHGGRVRAASDGPGLGATFTMYLPAVEATPPSSQRQRAPEPASVRSAITRRVLVVDDNEDAAEMLAEVLRSHGCEVHVAYDGASALVLAAQIVPDLAFLDIGLPVMDGYELAQRLRALPTWRDVRIVALTGYGHEQARLRVAAAGFDLHLVKPVNLKMLAGLVHEAWTRDPAIP